MSKPKPTFWTTKQETSKTVGEILNLLRAYGSRKMAIEYDDAGEPEGITFEMPNNEGIPVRLEAQTEGIEKRLRAEAIQTITSARAERIRKQSKRIAWRQLKSWVGMCLEMDENAIRPLHETMMADILDKSGRRVGKRFAEQFLLPKGSSE